MKKSLLFCLLLLSLTVWAYAAEDAARLGEAPLAPDGWETAALSDGGAAELAASGTNLQSGDKTLSKLTREEIGQLLTAAPLTLPRELYDVTPSVRAPYATGKVKEAALRAAVNRLNALRRIAGLAPVAMDADLNESAQYGAVLLNYQFSHTPPQPADMDDDFYRKGYDATSSSNIAMGYTLTGSVDGFMDDSDGGNVDRLGHRRWQLNPLMGKVGFGFAGRMTAEKVFDRSGQAGDYDFVAWPASGCFPSAQFDKNQAWSVSLNASRYQRPQQSALTVTLRRESDGKTWTFSGSDSYTAADSGKYYHVDTGGYGISNCIIFRPDGVEAYDGRYVVTIQGLRDSGGNGVEFSYEVEFFDAREYSGTTVAAVYAAPWRELHLTSEYADAATLAKLAALLPRNLTISTEDGREFSAVVLGDWTPDPSNSRWTATIDASAFPSGVTDPDNLLKTVSVKYTVDSYAGSLSVTNAAPAAGDSGQFRMWRYMSGTDAVELHQITASGSGYKSVLRYNAASNNYSVDGDGYCLFDVNAWTAADSGDWYGIYYVADSDWRHEAYLAGGVSVKVSGEDAPSLSTEPTLDGNVSVTVSGNPGEGATLYFAAYDADGRFLRGAVRKAEVPGEYAATLDLTGAARLSAFLMNADRRPLCPGLSVSTR